MGFSAHGTCRTSFFVGLDLGQIKDYTALSVVAKIKAWTGGGPPPGTRDFDPRNLSPGCQGRWALQEYQVRHLERFRLGTPYPEVIRRVMEIQRSPALQETPMDRERPVSVAVDATGVGQPVLDLMKAAGVKDLHAITITGGDSVVGHGWYEHRVPKRDLVSALQVLLQEGKLRIAEQLSEAKVLRAEFENFRPKITLQAGQDPVESWREGAHDDLVLSVALPCWLAHVKEPPDWSDAYPILKH